MNYSLKNQVSKIKPLFDYLKKQRENQKFVKTVEIATTFILISFFLFFAIRPTALTISSLLGDIKSKQMLKNELKTKINNVIKAQDLFSQVQEKYQIVDTSLPDRPKYYDAARQIQQTGSELGIAVDTINFSLNNEKNSHQDPNIRTYSVSLSIEGEFLSAMKFIDNLLANQRLINISSFGILADVKAKTENTDTLPDNYVNTGFSSVFYYWSPTNAKK